MLTRIRKLGDPVLTRPTDAITEFDDDLHGLVEDMIEFMYISNGVGLAANQIGITKSVFVYDDQNGHYGAICNPSYTPQESTSIVEVQEGCLSVPGEFHLTPRYEKITLHGQATNGRHIEIDAEKFLAQIWQHEVDHLNGKLYISKLPKATQMAIVLANQVI